MKNLEDNLVELHNEQQLVKKEIKSWKLAMVTTSLFSVLTLYFLYKPI